MIKEMTIFVLVAVTGVSTWLGQTVSAQDVMGNMDASGYMRRGVPGGARLRKVDKDAPTKEQQGNIERQGKIRQLVDEEVEKLKALSRDRSLSKEQKMEKARQIREATQNKIKALLTPEQLKKHEEATEKKRVFQEKLHEKKIQKNQQAQQTHL